MEPSNKRVGRNSYLLILGGIINKIIPSSLSVDQLITQGLYFGPIRDIPNRPSGSYAALVEVTKLVLSTRDTFILQRIISLQNGNTPNFGVLMRCSYDNGESWSTAWNSITTNVLS